MSESITTAVATRDNSPGSMIQQYQQDFAMVLPSHIKPETWVRLAVGLVRRDKKLAEACASDPASMMGALMDAARQGLEPGTEQYYLTPRKVKGKPTVLGIRGYQGEIELIYRAGAVSSVIVEVVRENDKFDYVPGRMDRPVHEIKWFAGDRGGLIGVYAYAIMKDGAVSKVVVLDRAHIAKAKAFSQGSDSSYSPWNTNEEAMWMKTAAHRLQKWVPTSAEYMREQIRAAKEVAAEGEPGGFAPQLPATEPPDFPQRDDSDVLDADVVDEPEQPAATVVGDPITTAQLTKLHTMLGKCGVTEQDAKRDDVSTLVGRSLASTKDLTKAEAMTVIDLLERAARDSDPAEALGQIIAELTAAQR